MPWAASAGLPQTDFKGSPDWGVWPNLFSPQDTESDDSDKLLLMSVRVGEKQTKPPQNPKPDKKYVDILVANFL